MNMNIIKYVVECDANNTCFGLLHKIYLLRNSQHLIAITLRGHTVDVVHFKHLHVNGKSIGKQGTAISIRFTDISFSK